MFSYLFSLNLTLSLQSYLTDQVKPLLGGDLVINSRSPIDIDLMNEYPNTFIGAQSVEFDSTLFIDDAPKLYEFLYFSDNFPLYESFSFEQIQDEKGVIIDEATYQAFGESIDIFGDILPVSGVITEASLGEFSLYTQPKIYIPSEFTPTDIDETNSRVLYKKYYRFVGEYDENIIEQIQDNYPGEGLRITSLSDRNETIGNITDRLYLFIHVFNVSIILLTFFIILISLETFFKKITPKIALFNVLGMSKRSLLIFIGWTILTVFFVSFITAVGVNILAFEYMNGLYSFFVFHSQTLSVGIGIMLILFLVGVSLPMYKVHQTSLGGLLKSKGDFSHFSISTILIYLTLFFVGFIGISLVSGISVLASFLYGVGSMLALVVCYIGVNWILKILSRILQKYRKNFYIFDAFRSTIKPGNISFLVVFLSIVSSLALFIFFIFSGSFLNYLSGVISSGNDMFIVNIQKNDRDIIQERFSEDQVFEIISARIDTINGMSLEDFLGVGRVSGRFSREFFSTTRRLDDPIISGTSLEAGGVSVGHEFAQDLGVKLGDRIVFSVAGLTKELKVVNTRKTEQNGTEPFFYFQLFPDDFKRYPKTYFAAYKQSEFATDFDTRLQADTPSQLTFIDIKSITELLQGVANNVIAVVYLCMAYIAVFCLLSFISSIEFLSQFKQAKIATLSLLGGDRRSLQRAGNIEYAYLVTIGLGVTLFFGTLSVIVLFSFIDFFSLSLWYACVAVGMLLSIIGGVCGYVIYWYKNGQKDIKK
ncbi:hypothetical protein MK079_02080 [Candidatus Gracilibacteria bacterium]|nr:hypothetical protein [Candidatus Gracilibacteria bacterium]